MRRLAPRLADAEVDRRLAEEDRPQLGVDIGQMDEGDVAERLEGEDVALREPLLREGPAPPVRQDGRRGGGDLEEVAAGGHFRLSDKRRSSRPKRSEEPGSKSAAGGVVGSRIEPSDRPGRPRGSNRQETVISSSAVIFVPSSSIQVKVRVPLSWALNLNCM